MLVCAVHTIVIIFKYILFCLRLNRVGNTVTSHTSKCFSVENN
jgi:hypothetical protein